MAKSTQKTAATPQTPLDKELARLGADIFKRDAKNRHAEDSEWYQAGLFYQMKQWITGDANGRWVQVKNDPKKPIPMPVSDYFSKTIDANSNSLGAKIPEMMTSPNDQSAKNRRAAQSAENAFDEMDKESGMDILNPVLSKHTTLWGLGVAKETVDTSQSTGMLEIPELGLVQQSIKVCPDCGYTAVGGQSAQNAPGTPQDAASNYPEGNNSAPAAPPASPDICPQCGAAMQTEDLFDVEPGSSSQFAKGKLCTEIVSILEIYLPRDCRDPNLSKRITHRYRKPKTVAQKLYPNAGELPETGKESVSQFYIESLRGLMMGSTSDEEMVGFTEIWAEWDQLDEDTQDAIETEWGNEPSQIVGYEQMTKGQAAKMYGIYWIFCGKTVVAKSENPWDGKKCFTFFPWCKDPASPYAKSLAVTLIPKQKQLNRLDCMMELSEQTHGVGKLMAPLSQMQTWKPTGNPVDIYWYDGTEGKQKPEFVLPQPYSSALPAKRAAIIQDFERLGYTQGVQQGDTPGGGVSSFRGIAYLGAKAEENIQTQRFLWEQAHQLRKELQLVMVRKIWDQPRQAKIAGFNGKFGMMELTGDAMVGDFGISVVKGSSRPKTHEENLNALQIAAQGGLVDMTDPQNRDWALNELGLSDVNQADHYNYVKFDRDLELLKVGKMPPESPAQKWDIWVKGLGNYTLTEEFEELDPAYQHGILMYFQYCSDKLTAVTQGVPPDPMGLTKQMAGALSGKPSDPLNGVPGQTAPPSAAEMGAQKQGNTLAQNVTAGAAA